MTVPPPKAGILGRLGFPNSAVARRYGLGATLNAVGTGLFYPFMVLYLHGELGMSLSFVGVGLGVATLLGAGAVGLVGRQVDALGAKPVLVAVMVGRLLSRIGYLFGALPAVFLLAAFLDAICLRLSQLSEQVLVAELSTKDDRPSWYALSRTALNAGMGLGSVLGGLLVVLLDGYRALLFGNMVGFAVAALLYARLPVTPDQRTVRPPRRAGVSPGALRDGVFVQFCAADALLWLCGLVFELAVPVALVEHWQAPGWTVSWIFALNTVLVTVLQGPVTRRAGRITLSRAVAIGAALYAAGMLLMIFAGGGLGILLVVSTLAVTVYTAGEIISGVAATTAMVNLAPQHERAGYLAVNHVLLGAMTALAPIVMVVTVQTGPWLTWLVLAGIAVVVAGRVAALSGVADRRMAGTTAS